MSEVKLLHAELDGKQIAYCSVTQFLIQIGKGPKGGYKTRFDIRGNLSQAVMYYNGINIGHNYKKRLVMVSGKPSKVLARAASYLEGPRGTCSYNW